MSRKQWLQPLVVVGLICVSSTVLAQNRPTQGPPPGGFGFGGGGFGGGLVDLLRREDVREELEIVDDQVQDLQAIADSLRDRGRELFGGLRDLSEEERREKFRSAIDQITKETEEKISEVLLPHQMKRAKQLAFQMRLRGGTARALTSGDLTEQLGVTDQQREALEKKSQEVEAELRQKTEQLRKEAQDKLFSVLNAEQRKKLEELVGEPFEFQRIEFRFGGDQQGRFGQGRRDNGGNRPGDRGDGRNRRPETE
jgi:Spy/CpxP family protein refolding chaperone